MTDDHTLGDHEHDQHDEGAHQMPASTYLTVDDVLNAARVVERTASICLRSDLVADHDRILEELSTLVTPDGRLIVHEEGEQSAGDQSNAARAQHLYAQLHTLEAEMRASMWHVRFRAMPSDEWTTFKKLWWPKSSGADMTEFRTQIVAKCAIEPAITAEQFKELRKKLGAKQIITLSDTAFDACSEGGLDVPKSPSSWASLKQQ